MTSKDQVVRYLSAKALASIRDEIGVDARMVGLTLEELGKAGEVEASDVVLAMIYRAACYKEHAPEVVEANGQDARWASDKTSGIGGKTWAAVK